MRLGVILALCLTCCALWGEVVPLRVSYDVLDIVQSNETHWILTGKVYDNTQSGYSGTDVTTQCLVSCETSYGDVDVYRVTELGDVDPVWVTAFVEYIPMGTNAVPRVGGPTYGVALLSAPVDTNGTPITTFHGAKGLSPFLADGTLALAVKILSARVLAEEGSSTAFGIWGVGPSGCVTPLSISLFRRAGLWEVRPDGGIQPSSNTWQDAHWTVVVGGIAPRE